MEKELVRVCFREKCMREFYKTGKYFLSSSWVSNWKEMSEESFEKWMNVIVKKNSLGKRYDIVVIKNEHVIVYEWDNEVVEYEMGEIPSWCKEFNW